MTYPPFTLYGYRETIQGLISRGYSVADFHEVDGASPHLVLRHDIDQSIARAHALAELEAKQHWRGTYFVLMRTEMYNPWSREAAQHLRDMIAMGHEVGLHLDATYYETEDELNAGAAAECRALEDILGQPIKLVSFHRPAKDRMGGDTPVAGRLHTYMDRFTKSIGYSSDSRGEWRHGHPWDHDAVNNKRALQLLTHAVWWVGRDGLSARETLATLLAQSSKRRSDEMEENNDVWRAR